MSYQKLSEALETSVKNYSPYVYYPKKCKIITINADKTVDIQIDFGGEIILNDIKYLGKPKNSEEGVFIPIDNSYTDGICICYYDDNEELIKEVEDYIINENNNEESNINENRSIIISNNTDLNNIKDEGFYFQPNYDINILNTPISEIKPFCLSVEKITDEIVKQMYLSYEDDDIKVFVRTVNLNGGVWKQILINNMFDDIKTNGKIIANRFIVNGGTSDQYLKANGELEEKTFSTSNHSHGYIENDGKMSEYGKIYSDEEAEKLSGIVVANRSRTIRMLEKIPNRNLNFDAEKVNLLNYRTTHTLLGDETLTSSFVGNNYDWSVKETYELIYYLKLNGEGISFREFESGLNPKEFYRTHPLYTSMIVDGQIGLGLLSDTNIEPEENSTPVVTEFYTNANGDGVDIKIIRKKINEYIIRNCLYFGDSLISTKDNYISDVEDGMDLTDNDPFYPYYQNMAIRFNIDVSNNTNCKITYYKGQENNDELNFIDMIYPVGSIYMSVNNVNPSILFGGYWEQIKDKFLLSAGENYSGGSTGGSSTVSLTKSQMPRHTHTQNQHQHKVNRTDGQFVTRDGTKTAGIGEKGASSGTHHYSPSIASDDNWWGTEYTANTTATNQYTGGTDSTQSESNGSAHENMPPYLVVYIWKRIG